MEISKNSSIVVLTGAGISKESGLDTFRGKGGIWRGVPAEQVATPEAFESNPELVHSFYNARKEGLLCDHIKPNTAHLALTKLEKEWPGNFLLVTQNVDNLHERAGSEKLIHMHGEILKARCVNCASVCPWSGEMNAGSICPNCQETGYLRVDVVWFGEMPMKMEAIYRALEKCDLFVSIGTSGNVYPAAGFVQVVCGNENAKTIELNIEQSLNADQFSQGIYGPASETVPVFVEKLLRT